MNIPTRKAARLEHNSDQSTDHQPPTTEQHLTRPGVGRRSSVVGRRLTHLFALLALLLGLLAPAAAIGQGQGEPVVPPPHDLGVLADEAPTWQGQYFANPNLAGAPVLTRADPAIDFDWGPSSPATTVPTDSFSVRWSRTVNLAAGLYRFSTYTDDGARLYVDGVLRINKWITQPPTEWQTELTLAAGNHTIVMEYFESSGDALARLSYALVQSSVPPNTWKGEYFTNTSLAGQPLLVRGDLEIDFDWGGGSPAPNFPSNTFSVRWTRDISVASPGSYRFATTTDDGVRLYIDGQIKIDQWVTRPTTLDQIDITLSAGTHHIVVEYFEQYGDALAKLSWARRAAAGEGIVRINAGGGAYADTFNNFWEADSYFTNANPTLPLTATISEEAQPIWNTTDDQLYINEHATAFRYDIPLPNGNYTVRLHFAELFFNAAGVRRFNVSIQGAPALSSFDIYAQAGKAALITKSFNTSVTSGTLTVNFSKVFDNAVVQALDVYPAGSEDLVAPVFAPIPEAENATYTTPPAVTYAITDNVKLKDIYWRIDDADPTPLFGDLNSASVNGQFAMPVDAFNALALGAHTLSFGANDYFGNAWTQTWRFRKLKTGSSAVPISFTRRTLLTPSTPGAVNFKHPTTLQFGPDGKLYAGQQDFFGKGGYIHILTLDDNRNVTNVQVINSIYNTPNVDTDGTPAPTVKGRHLIGLDFDPASTPQRPILWVVHSDPRFCFNQSPATCKVNVDSGIVTRLIGPDYDNPANRKDFVTGLPRSRENHAPNAVHFGPDGWLYISIGSNTNYGAVSTAFSGLAEDYLTASIVRVNVNSAPAASFPLDVRNVNSAAGLKPGVFELYANGYRNPYDFLWHSNGKLYANVNAGNFTAGNTPGPADGCPTGYAFDPGTRADYLALVEKGDFGGNPNPTHGQCVLDDGTMYPDHPRTPDPNYHAERRLLYYSNGTSSDGMAEYTAPTFGGQMLGNIISATYAGNQSVRRVVLAPDGKSVEFEEDLGIFSQPLDVAVGPDGSIYVAEYGVNDIQIMEPAPPLKETGIWTANKPLPIATQEVGTVACNGKVYLMGGLVGNAIDTGAVWVYDPGTKNWTAAAPYTTDSAKYVDHPAAACLNGKVYLIGGLVKAGPPLANIYEYTPATNSWAPKASLPAARGAMAAVAYGGKIYAVGGLGAGVKPYEDRPELYVYDPATNAWQTKAPMPTARDHLILEQVGGKLYAIGGRTAVTIQSVTAVNEVYDPASNTWSTRKTMPIPRAAMTSSVLHGQIQIWGGEAVVGSPYATPAGVNQQGQMYDPKTDTWTTITDELTPRHGAGGATLGSIVYVPGGATHQGNAATDTHDAFSFIATTPIGSCIPAGSDPATTDSDGDGYKNKDELDNGSDPCSTASTPPDNDADHVSDKNDPDDDNDGVLDVSDQFQFDNQNGTATVLPWLHNWNPGDPPAGKFGNSGFTGYQLTSKGNGFIADKVHVGGAGGFLSLDATAGTNQGNVNTQDNALQIGFDARQTTRISTRIADPFSGLAVEPGKSGGIFFGLNQDSYAKLVLTSSTGSAKPGLLFTVETGGNYVVARQVDLALPGPNTVDLFLTIDPATKRIVAQYRVDRDDTAGIITLGEVDASSYPGIAPFFKLGAAAGILTSNAAGTPFGMAYDYFRVERSAAPPPISHKVYLPVARR